MKILKLAKENLDFFAAILPAFGEVYAPVKRGKSFVFDKPVLWSDVQINYTRTILPPKKLMLPPCEEVRPRRNRSRPNAWNSSSMDRLLQVLRRQLI